MEAYKRVPKERNDSEIQENEVRITAVNKVRNYISYAMALLEEKGHSSVVLKGMGKAINKTVVVAEILKRRMVGLHQLTSIASTNIVDVWEPKEEGLDRLETTRRVSVITIILSREPLDSSDVGYQPPLPEDQVKPLDPEELGEDRRPRRPRGRGRGRGRGSDSNGAAGEEGAAEGGEGGGEGYRGRGRGRRGRGRGRRGGGPGGEGGEGDAAEHHEGGGGRHRGPRRNRPRRGGGAGGDAGMGEGAGVEHIE